MTSRVTILLSTLLLTAACAAPTGRDDDGPRAATSSSLTTTGGKIPCHFTVAGCEGEGPDGFAQDPNNRGPSSRMKA